MERENWGVWTISLMELSEEFLVFCEWTFHVLYFTLRRALLKYLRRGEGSRSAIHSPQPSQIQSGKRNLIPLGSTISVFDINVCWRGHGKDNAARRFWFYIFSFRFLTVYLCFVAGTRLVINYLWCNVLLKLYTICLINLQKVNNIWYFYFYKQKMSVYEDSLRST